MGELPKKDLPLDVFFGGGLYGKAVTAVAASLNAELSRDEPVSDLPGVGGEVRERSQEPASAVALGPANKAADVETDEDDPQSENCDKAYDLDPAIRPTSETAEQRLLDIMRANKSFTSQRDMAKRIGKSRPQMMRVVDGNAELSEWAKSKRQSVNAVQMTAKTADDLSTAGDLSEGLMLPEDCDAVRERAVRRILEKYSTHKERFFEALDKDDGWATLANCNDPDAMIDEMAEQFSKKRRDEFKAKKTRGSEKADR